MQEYYNLTLQRGHPQAKAEARGSGALAQRPSPAQLKGLNAAHESMYGNFKMRRHDGQGILQEQAQGARCLAEKWGQAPRVAGTTGSSVAFIQNHGQTSSQVYVPPH